uniref:Uncharacterized protein n=1 Tax=Ananas comosus var. bracteatus TaxID=296719 RepID=A0A6V7NYU5_ANACO|nr:unnamed protein product [Ananas comosus var. bracteatus]
MIVSWIFNSLASDLHDSIAYIDSAREIWTDLEERFSQGNAPRIHELKRELAITQQGTMSVATDYTKVKGFWDELNTYSNVPHCTCGAAKEFIAEHEKEKVHQFLMGLSEKFNIVRSQILSTDPLPSLAKVYALVTCEERQQSLAASRAPTIEAAAFNARNTKSMTFGTNKDRVPNRNKFFCEHCKKTNHTRDRCYELIGYPEGWTNKGRSTKGRQSSSNSANNATISQSESFFSLVNGLTKEQYDQLLSLLNSEKQTPLANFAGFGIETKMKKENLLKDDNDDDGVPLTTNNKMSVRCAAAAATDDDDDDVDQVASCA